MYFYELSESDDELFANVFLAHDSEYDEDEFLALVLEAREAVLRDFEEDSLIEAIAAHLERTQGFVQVETNIRAAVRVSGEEGETALTAVEERPVAPEDEDEFRTMLVDVEPEDRPWRN